MTDPERIEKLRADAEKIFRSKGSSIKINDQSDSILDLIEQLSIYQIELELQNEELRKNQIELANEKQRFEDLYLNAPIGYFLFDNKGVILDLNKKAAEILNVTTMVAKKQPFIAFLDQKDTAAGFMAHLNGVFQSTDQEEKEIEIIITDSNNNAKFIRLKSNMLHNMYCRTLAEDITEMRTNQFKISHLNNRMQAAMYAGDMAWWELELPSGNVYFNENKAKMLGYDPDDFKHYNDFMNLVHPEDYENTMEAFRSHLRGEKAVYECEYRIRNIENEYLWFHDIGRIINREDGIKLTGIVTNITTQKEYEKELHDSKNRLKTIIRTLPDLLFHFDKQGRFLTFYQDNPKLFKTPDEFLNKTIHDIFDKETAANFQNCIDETLKHGSYEYNYDLNIDTIRHFHAKYSKLNDNEIVALVRDITEQKKSQDIITDQNEKLKELNATKDKFFSIIAHDLKNPFSTILNYSELLAEYHSSYDESKTNEMIRSIRESAKHTYKLLENLLTWSRAQTGTIKYHPDTMNIRSLVTDAVQLLDHNAQSKELQVNNNVDDDLFALADMNTTSTVIRNMLSNAYKFTPKNGSVTIDSDILTENGKKYIKITISDTGVGIPENQLQNLFKIGDSISTKGTDNELGTGLGLILCKEFVEKNGGKLWVESKIDVGSKFHFTLPMSKPSEKDNFLSELADPAYFKDLKEEIQNKYGQAIEQIESNIKQNYLNSRRTSSFATISLFADQLNDIGKKYDLLKLERIGDMLKHYVVSFDIGNINKTLDHLKALFDE
jgi:PAS domain S-box-containing protein